MGRRSHPAAARQVSTTRDAKLAALEDVIEHKVRTPITEPLFLARYIEKAGTGTLDMIERCREAGLPPPEFRQDGEQFVQVLRRPPPRPGKSRG